MTNNNIIKITPLMKLRAYNQSIYMNERKNSKIKRYGNDYSNSEVDQAYINSIIGELGELAFREYLKRNNLYYSDDERELFNKGIPKNVTDMGDFFCSRTQENIDLKTNHLENARNILIKKWVHEWRPIKFYVLVSVHPLVKNKSNFDLDKITHATIDGYVSAEEFMNNGQQITKTGFGYPINKLKNFEDLFSKFYKNDEILPESRLITLEKNSISNLNVKKLIITDKKNYLSNIDYSYNLSTTQLNTLSNYKNQSVRDREKKVFIHHDLAILSIINFDNTLDIQVLIRSIRRLAAMGDKYNFTLAIPYYQLKTLVNKSDLDLIDYFIKDFTHINLI